MQVAVASTQEASHRTKSVTALGKRVRSRDTAQAMSARDQERISTLRRVYESFSLADFDTAIERAHPDIEFVPVGGRAPTQGAEALRAWMEPDAFEQQRAEPREFQVRGDKVLVLVHTWGRGAGSGIELNIDMWNVWTFDDDDRVTRLEVFLPDQHGKALEAAGLSE
jgi:ketosteroid isomerase-like protein